LEAAVAAPELVYEISRFDPSGRDELLVEKLQLLDHAGKLLLRQADGTEVPWNCSDVGTEISSRSQLHEVHADQITRIRANPAALRNLPLLLSAPGGASDLDRSLWSSKMLEEHIDDSRGEQRNEFRVLYVNGRRWGNFCNANGQPLLPDYWGDLPHDDVIGPTLDMWGRVTFGESASMTYGLDVSTIGLATPGLVALVWEPDQAEKEIRLERRGDDAEMFLAWLFNDVSGKYFASEEPGQILLTQLFVEVALGKMSGYIRGDYLVAGIECPELMTGVYGGSEWTLDIGMSRFTVKTILDRLVERGGPIADVVISARRPKSPQARARKAALDYWEDNHYDWRR